MKLFPPSSNIVFSLIGQTRLTLLLDNHGRVSVVTCCGVQELAQVAALLEEVVTILGPIRRDSEEGRTGLKVGTLTSRYYDKDPVL